MKRKIIVTDGARYGIRITHPDGSSGWIAGGDKGCLTFSSEAEAQKALRKMRKNDKYTWNCVAEVAQLK